MLQRSRNADTKWLVKNNSGSDLLSLITIDGPSASGKSTVSRLLAKALKFPWVSTGIFYRGLAYLVQTHKVSVEDDKAVLKLLTGCDWRVTLGEKTRFFVGGEDVTAQLDKEVIGNLASRLSQHEEVRKALLGAQRDCKMPGKGLIAEGRDCGTVVFPEAQLKIYLTADQKDRATRRALEEGVSVETIVEQQKERDASDANRETAPLRVPEDGVVIDTTNLSLEQVVDHILERLSAFQVLDPDLPPG